ncbi:MATE family efflux transporter [Pontibacter sp. G13]|uniref:MATE family efflux transporter n=1 Tax=Pontibacter sp. G13 TaxID=3074898 RepID=UPI00288C4459|nr:MATE family efflux transporter [Pontibacter sp. G13]WNJ16070.1 MATE family efflux transporter [Pontibacter sp. G13]
MLRTQTYERHISETLKLSFPVIIGQLGHVLMGVIDNMMIGQLGAGYLSAASLANGMFFVLTVIGIGITFAISPLVAEADAAKKVEEAGHYLRQGFWTALGVGVVLGAMVYGGSFLLSHMDQPESDVKLAFSYTQIISFSAIPMMLFLVFKQFADGLSLTKPAMYITMVGLVFNVVANWILIYGHFGFPRLELDGAGYGTLSSRIFMLIMMAGYVMWNKRFAMYKLWQGWWQLKGEHIKKILAIGFPSGLQYFFEVGAFIGAVVMIGWMDEHPVENRAAHQIAIQIAAITYMIVSGISAGATIRVGNAKGRMDFAEVRQAGIAGLVLGAGFMALSAIGFILFRESLPKLFVNGQEEIYVLTLASKLMIVAAFFQLFDGIQAVGLGILRGIQDVNIPTAITFFSYWVIAIPLGYVLCFPMNLGVEGIWYAFLVSLIVASLLLTTRFMYLTRKEALSTAV